jgi:hypothetical protein
VVKICYHIEPNVLLTMNCFLISMGFQSSLLL